MKTYTIINKNDQVVEYFRLLSDAKKYVVKLFDCNYSILVLRGQQFGEGYHTHKYTYNASKLKFSRESLR